MTVTKRHENAVKHALDILLKEPYAQYIDAIYLFGSCARGNCRFTSDVDLLVQCNNKLNPAIARSLRVAVMPESNDLPEVDLKFVKGRSWKQGSDHFTQNLVKEGVLLWEKK